MKPENWFNIHGILALKRRLNFRYLYFFLQLSDKFMLDSFLRKQYFVCINQIFLFISEKVCF